MIFCEVTFDIVQFFFKSGQYVHLTRRVQMGV